MLREQSEAHTRSSDEGLGFGGPMGQQGTSSSSSGSSGSSSGSGNGISAGRGQLQQPQQQQHLARRLGSAELGAQVG